MQFKPLHEQVIVLTGATSGIGLLTARRAAKAGAKLVLAARDEDSLRKLVEEINAKGGQAIFHVTDVGDEAQVRALSQAAIAHFGGFDTWINNAGLAIYGRMRDIPSEDHRKLFDTNFWGIVYGSLEAARHFRERAASGNAGNIINLGSTVSDRALPVQGMYSVSKHAIKGFTDALRMELEHEKLPVALCLIKPSAINTPFPQHARNYMEQEPTLPPPIYAPELVADAILKCVVAPQRDLFVGGGGKMMSLLGQYAPRLGDKLLLKGRIFEEQTKDEPARQRPDSLYDAGFGMQERGEADTPVVPFSPYTKWAMLPLPAKFALAGVAGIATMALLQRKSKE